MSSFIASRIKNWPPYALTLWRRQSFPLEGALHAPDAKTFHPHHAKDPGDGLHLLLIGLVVVSRFVVAVSVVWTPSGDNLTFPGLPEFPRRIPSSTGSARWRS